MHPRNRFAAAYDLDALQRVEPGLAAYRTTTPAGAPTLDFASAEAVRLLNKALLSSAYGIEFWDLPPGSLCPAVPGRLEYVHLLADLLAEHPPRAAGDDGPAYGLDLGTGASLIYPVLAVREYGWRMVGTDIDDEALRCAGAVASFNPALRGRIELRRQRQPGRLFAGVVTAGEYFDFSMCNPPFFASAAAAEADARRKARKLHGADADVATRNFGGRPTELWTSGGEPAFLKRMIAGSARYHAQVGWFTTLVSKRAYLRDAHRQLARTKARDIHVRTFATGHKQHQVIAWRY